MIKAILFLLAVMTLCLVVIAPLVGSLIWLHRHTFSRAAFAAWVVGAMIYVATASVLMAATLNGTGLIRWVAS